MTDPSATSDEERRVQLEVDSYRQMIEAVSDAVFVHDAVTGNIVDVNSRVLDLFGLTREEALNLHPADLSAGTPPYSHTEAGEWMRRSMTEGPQEFEWLSRHKNGELFPTKVTLSSVRIGTSVRIVAVAHDLSEQQRARQALERQTRFEALVADISTRFVSVAVEDVDAAIEEALGEVARFAGVNAGYLFRFSDHDRLFGMTHLWNDGVLSTRKEGVRDLPVEAMPWWMGRVFRNEVVSVPSVADLPEAASVEKGIISSQGVKAVIDVPLMFQGRVVGVLGFNSAYDSRAWSGSEVALLRFVGQVFISAIERKRAEQDLRKVQEQLLHSQKMEAVGRLAGGVAHDFNNLLTAIMGYAELAGSSLSEEDPSHGYVEEIGTAAQRAAALTGQLLAFSRKHTSLPRVIQINAVIDRARKMLARIIGEDVELTYEAAPDLGNVKIDPTHVEQILVNLATNARDAMPDGGHLTITTENRVFDAARAEAAGLARAGEYVSLSVRDDGVGMAPELHGQIFEPFFSTKQEGKGSGLGLSTVYGLARQNDGAITFRSEVGSGSTFAVHLPRVTAVAEDVVTGGDGTAVPRGSERILLVEDEELVRTLAAELLTRRGYSVVVASGGEEACRLVEQEGARFDLLLTDVIMPRMKGPEVYARLLGTQPELRCLYVSGYAEDVIVHHGVTDADTRLLPKPFTNAALAFAVRDALDAPGA